jgi:hypothetical protein
MAGFHDNSNTLRLENLRERKGNLLRQPFLQLEASSKHLSNACKLGQSKDSAVRDISNVHLRLSASIL